MVPPLIRLRADRAAPPGAAFVEMYGLIRLLALYDCLRDALTLLFPAVVDE